MARARVDDDVRTPLGIDGHAFGRDDAHERIVHRPRERAAVDDRFVSEMQDRRQTFSRVLDEVVAALADRVPEQDRSLCGVDGIAVPVRPDVRGGRGMGQHRAQVIVEGFLKLLGKVLLRHLRALLEEDRDLGRRFPGCGIVGDRVHGICLHVREDLFAEVRFTGQNALRHVLERNGRGLVAPDLALGQPDFRPWDGLVGNLLQQVTDHVQPHALLVLRARDEPRRPCGIGGGEHLVARLRVVVPAIVGLEVHRRELPGLAAVVDARCEPARLLLGAHLEPVLEQDDAGVDHQLLERRRHFQEALRLLLGAEAHHALDTRPVVPAAVEDHDLARRRKVRQIALHVHLGLLALGRRGERDDAKHPRAHPLGDRLDGAALAGAVAALEDDADLEPLELDPLLQLDELHVELFHLSRIVLPGDLALGRRRARLSRGPPWRHHFRPSCPCASARPSAALFFPIVVSLGLMLRSVRSCLQRLIAFDRRAGVEQHALAAESFGQPGISHDLQYAGIQARPATQRRRVRSRVLLLPSAPAMPSIRYRARGSCPTQARAACTA